MTQLPPLPYPQPPNLPGEATALRAVALSALGQDAFGSLQAANQSLKTFKDLFFFFFSAGRNGAGGDTFSGSHPPPGKHPVVIGVNCKLSGTGGDWFRSEPVRLMYRGSWLSGAERACVFACWRLCCGCWFLLFVVGCWFVCFQSGAILQ